MIVYQATKKQFVDDALDRDIEQIIADAYQARTGRHVGPSEFRSWKESLLCMARVLREDIPDDAGVAVEYGIPQTAKRVDFIVTGRGDDDSQNIVIVELKQWQKAYRTEKDAVVRTRFKHGESETPHPSYQAWSYAALLQSFNDAVYDGALTLQPCAYLHNYVLDDQIAHAAYQTYLDRAPIFLKGDVERERLRRFIARHVKYGDDRDLIYKLEHGRIRPSKMLCDSLVGMLRGNREFVLIDDQKVVYESSLRAAELATVSDKQIVVVRGGPGTGKSVLAINLLVELTKRRKFCRYVSKNAAPRTVYESRLVGTFRKSVISNLFSGSGCFVDAEPSSFDVLIVDEAHRLNEKSGLYANLGENQIKEIVAAAKCVIFFVDDDQVVTFRDIGRSGELERWGRQLNGTITKAELASQFRCNGSEGYLAWLSDVLQIRETANERLGAGEFDFRVLDSPKALHALIKEKNRESNKARMVAGYCWKWPSKKSRAAWDIEIPEQGYQARWNLTSDGSLWMVSPRSVSEVGCIHTCQGLEAEYIGVIVGPDLVVRDGRVVTRPEARASSDRSLAGYKALLKTKPDEAAARADLIIKNTYRTLMTRGMKGCYVYCTDPETTAYLRSRLPIPVAERCGESPSGPARFRNDAKARDLPFATVPSLDQAASANAVPLMDLRLAAGAFRAGAVDEAAVEEWAVLPDWLHAGPGLFVAQVVGESMNRRIPSGSWCLFRANPQGTRNGKVVIVCHRSIADPDTGGDFTVKIYRSEKLDGPHGSWSHTRVWLEPDSSDPRFGPVSIEDAHEGDFVVVAELLAVLGSG